MSNNIVNIDGRDRRPWALVSREKLLRAAIAEIADRGYEKARLVDIAKRRPHRGQHLHLVRRQDRLIQCRT